VPALSQLFRTVTPQPSVTTSNRADLVKPLASKQATLSQRLRRELIEYLIISAYLYICFGSLILYKATILHSDGIAFASFGIAIVKAPVLGKFILVLDALKIGERKGGAGVLFADILKKSVLFVIFLIALTAIEEMIVGYFHGRTSQEVLSEMPGGTLPQAFAVSILVLLILIPYFAFRGRCCSPRRRCSLETSYRTHFARLAIGGGYEMAKVMCASDCAPRRPARLPA
jgi:hypothetical protein